MMVSKKYIISFTSFLLLLEGSESFSSGGGTKRHGGAFHHTHRDARPRATSLRTYLTENGGSAAAMINNKNNNKKSNLFSLDNDKQQQQTTIDESSSYGDTQDMLQYENKHSASDWLHNVFSLPSSQILREIRNPVFSAAVWGTIVSIIQKLLVKSTNSSLKQLGSAMCIGHTPHSFLVSSLGLLLVFRTNSAYGRFNEGRKIWGNIMNDSRSLSRMLTLYGKEVGSYRKNRILNLLGSFSYLLRHHVREGCLCDDKDDIAEEHAIKLEGLPVKVVETRHDGDKVNGVHMKDRILRKPCWVDKRNLPWSLFENKALTHVAKATNRPLWVCDRIGREVMSIPYGPNFTSRERLTLLGKVDKLTNTIGECERIHQTAVPLNYARHALRSLTLWLFTLPFALVKDLGFLTGPVVGIVAWLMFGVYQIGHSIEDPFQGSLRLSILCDAIRRDVMDVADAERSTAFSLDEWVEDDDDEEMDDGMADDIMTKELDMASKAFSLQTPDLVKENNGSWNVVGVVEG